MVVAPDFTEPGPLTVTVSVTRVIPPPGSPGHPPSGQAAVATGTNDIDTAAAIAAHSPHSALLDIFPLRTVPLEREKISQPDAIG
jgi:hypothetical protein